jgi:hypothetical protein
MKVVITTSVVNGKFTRNRTTVLQAINSFNNSVVLTFDKPKKKGATNKTLITGFISSINAKRCEKICGAKFGA